MSKERLEKIEEKHNELIKENQLYTSMFLDTEWLIEQVKLSNDVKEDLRLSEEEEDKRWKQNKRYREAIEKVLYETGDKVIQNILETVLEDDEK